MNTPTFDEVNETGMRIVRQYLGIAHRFEAEGRIQRADACGATAANVLAGVVHREAQAAVRERVASIRAVK